MLLETKNKVHNVYNFECYRPDGSLRWAETLDNLVVDEGLNDLLSKWLKGSSYTAAWYVGLIDNANYTGVQASDTATKINTTANPPTTNSWQELVAYDESVRQTLTLGAVSGQSVNNGSNKATFTISATKTIKGAFVVSTNTKGGTSGVLLGGGAFTNARDMYDDDVLQITITCTSASG